jgi:hypothetical protein
MKLGLAERENGNAASQNSSRSGVFESALPGIRACTERGTAFVALTGGAMLEHTAFLFSDGPVQVVAFILFAICALGFCAWLVYLVRE